MLQDVFAPHLCEDHHGVHDEVINQLDEASEFIGLLFDFGLLGILEHEGVVVENSVQLLRLREVLADVVFLQENSKRVIASAQNYLFNLLVNSSIPYAPKSNCW